MKTVLFPAKQSMKVDLGGQEQCENLGLKFYDYFDAHDSNKTEWLFDESGHPSLDSCLFNPLKYKCNDLQPYHQGGTSVDQSILDAISDILTQKEEPECHGILDE